MWTLYIYISVPCGLALCTRRSRYRLDHHTKRIDPAEGRPRLPCRAARGIRLSHHSHGHADRASHQRVGKAAVHALAKDQPCGDKRRRELTNGAASWIRMTFVATVNLLEMMLVAARVA